MRFATVFRGVWILGMVMVLMAGCGNPNLDAEPAPAPSQPAVSGDGATAPATPAETPAGNAGDAAPSADQQQADLQNEARKVAESMNAVEIAPGLYALPEVKIPEDPAEKAKMEEEIVNRWKEMSKQHKANPKNPECMVLALKLSEFGTMAIKPLIDIIDAPDEDPYIKVLVVECVRQLVTKDHVDLVIPMTADGKDATTRACATLLLGQMRSPKGIPVLQKLSEDPDKRIQFSALRGLAMVHEPKGRDAFIALFDQGLGIQERNEFARVFVNDVDHDKQNVPVLCKIIQATDIEVRLRSLGVAALGRSEDPSAIPTLKLVAEKDPDASVREVAASAASVMESREKLMAEKAAMPTEPAPSAAPEPTAPATPAPAAVPEPAAPATPAPAAAPEPAAPVTSAPANQ